MPPRLSAQASRQGTWSMLIPRTWVFNPSNRSNCAWYDGIWPDHMGVQACGKNTSTTFWPRYWLKVIDRSPVAERVKSGAIWPTASFIDASSNKICAVFPQKIKKLSRFAISEMAHKSLFLQNHYTQKTGLIAPFEICARIIPLMTLENVGAPHSLPERLHQLANKPL